MKRIDYMCSGVCHQCKEQECENHPQNYDRQLEFASTFLLDNEEQLAVLRKMMNSKLKHGLSIMEFEEIENHHARDYVLTTEDFEYINYAESVVKMIQEQVQPANFMEQVKF